MIDLGQWASESYRVAADEKPDDEDEATPKPPGS